MCDDTNGDMSNDDNPDYDCSSSDQSNSKKWVAYTYQGIAIATFDTEREAWKHLDQCDMSGTVKED